MKAEAGTARPGPDRTRRPPPGPERPLRLPEVWTHRLANGLELHVARQARVPELSLRLVVEAGSASEPSDRAGVAELTGRLLTEGAGEDDAEAMAARLDRLGASFSVSVAYDVTTLAVHCLSEVTDGTLAFLADAVRRPRFEEAEVDRVRAERLDEIERERDEPAVVADHLLIEAVYGPDHPYGRPAAGPRRTVATLDAAAVRAFHRRRYVAGGAFLVACGDVEPEHLLAEVERHFGDWPGGAEPPVPPGAPAPNGEEGGERSVLLVDRPGSPQAEVRVGGVGIQHGAPDLFPVKVANAVLGGLFNSRLNMNLREDKGWTYGARSAFRLRRGPGPFVACTAVETGVTAGAFREIEAELRGLAERPPEGEELRLARNALTRSLPLQFETNAQVCRRLATRLAYGLPDDYWETYRDRVAAVSPDDVASVAARWMRPDRLVRVAVTDAEAARGALEGTAQVELRPSP